MSDDKFKALMPLSWRAQYWYDWGGADDEWILILLTGIIPYFLFRFLIFGLLFFTALVIDLPMLPFRYVRHRMAIYRAENGG